jgi:hypothetical protein
MVTRDSAVVQAFDGAEEPLVQRAAARKEPLVQRAAALARARPPRLEDVLRSTKPANRGSRSSVPASGLG